MALKILTTGLENYAPGGSARVKVLVIGGPGAGKRLDVETAVATPSGWRRFGDLQVGDEVIGSNGRATMVTGIFDEGIGPAYRITFNDQTSVVADGEHLWSVQTRKARQQGRPYVVLSTEQLRRRGVRTERNDHRKAAYQFYLPLVQSVAYPEAELAIEPYLLGALLANGSFTSGVVNWVSPHEEVFERVMARNLGKVEIAERTYETSTCRRWCVFKFHKVLDELGLDQLKSEDKFIPAHYLVAGIEQRWDLLRGLMDGDGSVQAGNRARYHTISHQLAYGVRELVQSLGGVARVDSRLRTQPTSGASYTEYTVSLWTPQNPFTVQGKAQRYGPRPGFRAIESIEPVEPRQMRCIRVDAPDELYVVAHYILTHNTRWASYFPRPMYADCEAGLASVADRQAPYVTIRGSQDMLDLLEYLKQEQRQPWEQRKFQTIVIDTVDAYQRKVKNEWMERENKSTFTGWDAWGYLNSKMGLLMTRLLNLDMNVVVNVHFKSKTVESGEQTTTELALQLQGETADTIFNDFDLVGWMGTYWEQVEGQRVEKRGLTFHRTPDKAFLKDRLHVTPKWLEVTFDDSDYSNLFAAINSRAETLAESHEVGEIQGVGSLPGGVIAPGQGGTGPVALEVNSVGEIAFKDLDRPTLLKLCRERNITALTDGTPIRGNTLKGELITALEAARDAPPTKAESAKKAEPARPAPKPEPKPEPKPQPPRAAAPIEELAKEAVAQGTEVGTTSVQGVGVVDTRTGEVRGEDGPSHDEAVQTLQAKVGASVLGDTGKPPAEPAPRVRSASAGVDNQVKNCDVCGMDLSTQNPNLVRLALIKFQRNYCEAHFRERKAGLIS